MIGMAKILHPSWITVTTEKGPHKGYDQDWYPQKRQQIAGCGPTVGAMMAAYAARKEKGKAVASQEEAVHLMLDIWKYATPRRYGLYKVGWLRDGLSSFLKENGLSGHVHALPVSSLRILRPSYDKVLSFIKKGLDHDEPVGFLNLESGNEPIPFPWHWMAIVGIKEKSGTAFVTLWDGGQSHVFDLKHWLSHSKFGGGFVSILS
jgi:hypothetical protein